ncbi:MAG TPA: hypothetical protein QF850_02980 [Acidimicrobiales bacterium]|jgi:hypothetical protein|nr:hypothetical protein [Acidimicrobiales bacterium]|tara:strand:- start:7787 stop:8341 length:555 start_codon:yes stop_codon:yes gene_type:complete
MDDPLDEQSNPLSLTDSAMWSFFIQELSDKELGQLQIEMQNEIRRRAIQSGDHDAIIKQAFEVGFERSGLGVMPWIEGQLLICPGALVSRNPTSHRCRFVSVNEEWVWQSGHLITETKRPSPGTDKGFRAIALIPVIEGLAIDIVSGKMQSGQHRAEKVISFEIVEGKLSEVSQRVIPVDGMHH